jgi:hydrogenase/urease accessory protein HupE
LPFLQLDLSGGLAKACHQADGLSPAPIAKAKEQHMKKFLMMAATLAFTTTAALAHPGEHALTVLKSLAHVLTEPDHLAMIAVAIVVVGGLLYKHARRAA